MPKVSKKGWVYKPQTAKRAKQSRAARKGQLKPLCTNVKGGETSKPLHSSLGTLRSGKVSGMIHGSVAHNVKNLDNPGKAKVKRNRVFSNAIPHGYTRKEWEAKLKTVLR